jgi:biotin carboxyl carrier protein
MKMMMSYEVNINGEDRKIEILHREGNRIKVLLGDKTYDLDIVEQEPGVYSVLHNGKNFNFELNAQSLKKYLVGTPSEPLEVEVVDAETRYMRSRKAGEDEDTNFISTPMPGQVVKILVEEGQKVKGGETVIIVSAMKMESEYKVVKDRVVKEILVKEGDNIDGEQPLITFE